MRTLIATSAVAAMLLGAPLIATAQTTGTGSYCLKGESGPAKCEYQSMAQCEQAKKSGDQCLSKAETTGSAGGSSPSPSSSGPSGGMAPKQQ